MPRTATRAFNPIAPTLRASAQVLTVVNGQRKIPRQESWQDRAWQFYDQIGELEFAMRFFRNVAERLTYFPALVSDDPRADPAPIDPTDWIVDPDDPADADPPEGISEGEAHQILDIFQAVHLGHSGGFGGLVGDLVVQVGIAGEGYIAPHPEDGWCIYSTSELRQMEAGYRLFDAGGDEYDQLGDDDPVYRIYEPHPRFRRRAHSSIRSVTAECEELLILGRQVRATGLSRLHAGGLLLVPDELSFGTAGPEGDDDFLAELTEALIDPISNEGSPAAVVPGVIRGPAELLAEVRFVELSRTLDKVSMDQRNELLTRLANGLDLPAEIITGVADLNHWSAWVVDEQAYLQHADPRIRRILDALSRSWWQALLTENGVPPGLLERVVLWRDHSDLTGHPNKYTEAESAHDRGAISDSALRREGGFDDTDAPSEEELLRRLIMRTGVAPPVSDLPGIGPPDEDREEEAPPEAPPAPAPPRMPVAAAVFTRSTAPLAALEAAVVVQLLEAADAAIDRALERAGARLRTRLRGEVALAVGQIPNLDLAARVGRDLTEDFGIRSDELLPEGTFNSLSGRVERLLRGFLAAMSREVTKLTNRPATDVEALSVNVEGAAARFTEDVAAAAERLLFTPARERVLTEGEIPAVSTPSPLARLAIAALHDPAVIAASADAAITPLADSDAVLGDLAKGGLQPEDVYEWVYGPFPRDPFDPHVALDGQQFTFWDDPVLTNGGPWPRVGMFFPGDHPGCLCSYIRPLTQTRQPRFLSEPPEPPLPTAAPLTPPPPPSPPAGEVPWQPMMTAAEAEEFIASSKITDTWYHGTPGPSGEAIASEGFRRSEVSMFGEGVYFAPESRLAQEWGERMVEPGDPTAVISSKVKLTNPVEWTDLPSPSMMAKYENARRVLNDQAAATALRAKATDPAVRHVAAFLDSNPQVAEALVAAKERIDTELWAKSVDAVWDPDVGRIFREEFERAGHDGLVVKFTDKVPHKDWQYAAVTDQIVVFDPKNVATFEKAVIPY
jgi:hypothetical protein